MRTDDWSLASFIAVHGSESEKTPKALSKAQAFDPVLGRWGQAPNGFYSAAMDGADGFDLYESSEVSPSDLEKLQKFDRLFKGHVFDGLRLPPIRTEK